MSHPDTHTLSLNASATSLAVVGGKGQSLAAMARAGMPVPAGFHLTTSAYRRFVEDHQLQGQILDLARPTVSEGSISFASASSAIQELFETAALSAELVAEIRKARSDLQIGSKRSHEPVAVRSSATAEDLPGTSFAGQQDTYLNVRGDQALLSAIRNCWASLWSVRAMSYRHQMGIDHDQVAMAVVIQRMVAAEVSGVLFTANPASGDREEMIVNASYGLGEAIVSGEVTPDTYVLDRAAVSAKEIIIGTKQQMVIASGDEGTKSVKVDASQRDSASLNGAQIAELATLAVTVEELFDDSPQDIEWLFAEGKPWLLQSRPITNLPPPPLKDVRWDAPEPGAYLGRSQLVEHIPDPVCTLFEDLHMKRSLQHYWGLNLVKRGNHDFVDTQPPACFVVQTTINGFAYRHLGEPPRTGRLRPTKRMRSRPPGAVRRFWSKMQSYAYQIRTYGLLIPEWRYVSLPRYLRKIRRWRRLDPQAASVEQLWTGIRAMSKAEARYWYRGGVWNAFSLTRGTEFLLHNFLQEHAPNRFTSGQFLSGLRSRAFNAQMALSKVAKLIRSNDVLYSAVLAAPPKRLLDMLRAHPQGERACREIDRYLNSYGHQIFTLDFVEPSDAEEPANIMQSLYALVLQTDYDAKANQRAVTQKRNATLKEANDYFQGELKWQFRWLLWKARHFYPNREEAMFHMGKAWTVLRPLAKELGQRLVEAGTLTCSDDIYFLTTDELARAIRTLVVATSRLAKLRPDVEIPKGLPEYQQLTAERRQLREARRRLTPPMHVPGPPLWSPPADSDAPVENSDTLKGSAVSPGQVTAQVSLILSPADFGKMKPGTILVCPTTTPAWTQLFPQAKGLVTDIGGILAHGSIVAREYGIPAVLGLGDITKLVVSGQVITVDGTRGTVNVASAGEQKP